MQIGSNLLIQKLITFYIKINKIKKLNQKQMEIYSSVNNGNHTRSENEPTEYKKLMKEYTQCGFTYKSNEILHKLSQRDRKHYPYDLLLQVSKMFHLNQFEIIFFTHVLTEAKPCYEDEPEIFNIEDHKISSEIEQTINVLFQQSHPLKQSLGEDLFETKKEYKNLEEYEEEENQDEDLPQYTLPELKKIYLYLLVVAYAIKFYLNDPMKIKPYEEHIKQTLPNFFSNTFNHWAKKYGNSVLNTTPRKINAYYMALGFLEGQEDNNDEKQGQDCQYRNYNEIVQELIKATKQNDEQNVPIGGDQIRDQDASQNIN